MKFTTEGFDAQIRRAEERGREESSSEIAALREAVRVLNTASKCDMCDGHGWYMDCGAYGENPVQYQCFGCCGSGWRGAERVLYHPAVRRALEEER